MRILKEVTIEILQRCNSNCIFCSSNSSTLSENIIPLYKIIDIIDFCKSKGAKTINISGGEPLLHSNILDVINYCNSKDLNCVIYTSGNVEIEKWNNILEKISNPELIKFIFNYSSINNSVYQNLIGSKLFSVDELNLFIKTAIMKMIQVEVHIVPNNLNLSSLYNTVKYLKSIGIKQVSFLRLVFQGRAQENASILEIDENRFLNEIKRIIDNFSDSAFNIRGGVPFSLLLKNKCECFAGISKLIFRYDGIVFPCEAFKEAPDNIQYMLGSIYKDSLESIWNNHPVHNKLSILKRKSIQMDEPCPAQLLYF